MRNTIYNINERLPIIIVVSHKASLLVIGFDRGNTPAACYSLQRILDGSLPPRGRGVIFVRAAPHIIASRNVGETIGLEPTLLGRPEVLVPLRLPLRKVEGGSRVTQINGILVEATVKCVYSCGVESIGVRDNSV